jgi:cytochrome c oxidase subunit 2
VTGRRLRRFGAFAAAAAAVAGCYPASPGVEGQQIQDLYRLFFAGGVIVAFIVWGLATWIILRYRRRDERLPVQTHGNTRIEIIWTAIPLLTVLGLFGATYVTLQSVSAESPNPAVTVNVTGFRWQWQFVYANENVTIVGQVGGLPELVVPVGEPVHVTVTAVDVIHSFYVPALLYKMDAIPGHVNSFDFTVAQAGTYGGFCAELCGVYHDRMLFSLRAVSPADYATWLAGARSQPQPLLATPAPGSSAAALPSATPPSGSSAPSVSSAPSGSTSPGASP